MRTSDDILIKDFYRIMAINNNDEILRYDKEIEILKIIYPDRTEDELIDLPLEEVDEMLDAALNQSQLEIFQTISIGNRHFDLKGNPDDFKFSFRQYKNFEKSVYDSQTEYVHLLMADIYVDSSEFEERAQYFYENMTMRYASFFIIKLPSIIEKKIIR